MVKLSSIILPGVLLILGTCSRAFGQTEGITSRFYFPGGIGFNFPTDNDRTDVNRGLILITALEYRPVYENAFFIRFNYDAVNNHYQRIYNNSPTNVNTGKLASSVFSLGVGYRQKAGVVKVFGLMQPGWAVNSYDKVSFDSGNISVAPVSQKRFSLKFTTGMEYYLVPHFALTFEPSYYYLFSRNSKRLLNSQSLNMSVGFTTTLF